MSFILIHMDAHLQLIYSITIIRDAPSVRVFIQNIKFRKMIVIVQRVVCICLISVTFWDLKMQY